ncbi:MAG: hypothetical protein GX601_10010 [Anaerolineales bacterium]|nr:hypothetical protein [Anaerolineales bacterium]
MVAIGCQPEWVVGGVIIPRGLQRENRAPSRLAGLHSIGVAAWLCALDFTIGLMRRIPESGYGAGIRLGRLGGGN